MSLFERLEEVFGQLGRVLFSFGTDFNLPSLAVAFFAAMAFLTWRRYRRRGRRSLSVIRRAVFRRKFLSDRSVRADLGMFFVNTLAVGGLVGWGAFGADAVSAAVTNSLTAFFGARPPIEEPQFVLRIGATLTLFVAYEFGYWLDHYLKHRIPFLWETHKPHHSAETLTPLTVWRVHPLDTLIFSNILALAIGGASGLLNYGMGREIRIISVDGANIFLVFFIYAYLHLQHSQFWIPFGEPFGRIFMSPAQHQIHHSIDPRHHNRNFGSCLSLFDWLFGTLELPPVQSPRLTFGVDRDVADPHSLTTLLILPTIASLSLLAASASGAIRASLAARRRAGRVLPR